MKSKMMILIERLMYVFLAPYIGPNTKDYDTQAIADVLGKVFPRNDGVTIPERFNLGHETSDASYNYFKVNYLGGNPEVSLYVAILRNESKYNLPPIKVWCQSEMDLNQNQVQFVYESLAWAALDAEKPKYKCYQFRWVDDTKHYLFSEDNISLDAKGPTGTFAQGIVSALDIVENKMYMPKERMMAGQV